MAVGQGYGISVNTKHGKNKEISPPAVSGDTRTTVGGDTRTTIGGDTRTIA